MRIKILIIRFSSIGDIILTTPVVRCLQQQLPDAEIHFLTKPQYAFLLKHNPYITNIHTLDHSIFSTALKLKNEGFSYVIDLHNNLRTAVIKSVLGVPAYSFNKLNFEKTLLTHFRINILPELHIVDRYLETVSSLGVTKDTEGLDYFIADSVIDGIAIKNLQHIPKTKYIAIAIGAQHATKRLPNEKLVAYCKSTTTPIVLLGGENDKANGEFIQKNSGSHVTNLAGALTFDESAFLIQHASKVITHDTGLMHVAAAFDKNITVVWGNTIPEFGMAPYMSEKSEALIQFAEVKNLSCRPCSKIGFEACPKSHFNCMKLQNVSTF